MGGSVQDKVGQSSMGKVVEETLSVRRLVVDDFQIRRLQYTEHQQLEGWRWNRPGDRILDIGKLRESIA